MKLIREQVQQLLREIRSSGGGGALCHQVEGSSRGGGGLLKLWNNYESDYDIIGVKR